jgi:nitrite reductase (NADH) small subunit
MLKELSIGPVAQIPEGEGRTFDVGGQRIAVFRTRGGEIFALQAMCPHRDGPLADGLLGGATVLCPLHDRAFDLRSGGGIGHDGCVRSYPARISQTGTVLVVVA